MSRLNMPNFLRHRTFLHHPVIQGGAAAVPQVLLIEDAFTGDNMTQLYDHTIAPTNIPAATWIKISGSDHILILSNHAKVWGNGGVGYVAEAGVSDCVLEADFVILSSPTLCPGLTWRNVDASNEWICYEYTTLNLSEVTGGTETVRASETVSLSAGPTYHWIVTLAGASMTCELVGIATLTYSSSVHQTATRHGIMGLADVSYLDNFKVTG
jgi:hypothetical protein